MQSCQNFWWTEVSFESDRTIKVSCKPVLQQGIWMRKYVEEKLRVSLFQARGGLRVDGSESASLFSGD